MARRKGQVVIDKNDIVGKCLGKYQVDGYSGMRYDQTAGGERLRHWYNCTRDGKTITVQRGQILASGRNG